MHWPSGKANKGEVKEGRFCSNKCKWDARRKPVEPKLIEKRSWHCKICGKEMSVYGVYCSDECRKENARRESRASNSAKKQLKERSCKECGKMFVPEYGNKRRHYCSDACSRRQGRRNAKHTRRTRGKAVKGATVYRAKIYERDGWKCQICGKKVNRLLDGSHPMAASLDHIVPLSKGGRHEPSNVRLAHRKCNTAKADRSGPNGDQLLLFG
jgi:5-methylcytosine-specific restriction endonuclease McrA/predicted nucleic acid-binding Zn ribbon protein